MVEVAAGGGRDSGRFRRNCLEHAEERADAAEFVSGRRNSGATAWYARAAAEPGRAAGAGVEFGLSSEPSSVHRKQIRN